MTTDTMYLVKVGAKDCNDIVGVGASLEQMRALGGGIAKVAAYHQTRIDAGEIIETSVAPPHAGCRCIR